MVLASVWGSIPRGAICKNPLQFCLFSCWAFLRGRLGDQAPNDTTLLAEETFNLKRETVNYMPEAKRPEAIANLNHERIQTQMDDLQWSQWYDHYHQRVLTDRNKWSIQAYVHHGLAFNLETASIYTLLSALFVPAVRHWWCILPALMWVVILLAQEYTALHKMRNPWATLTEQIVYLSESESGTGISLKTSKD